ncbi:MAG: DUF1579 domain-containing protein [Bacteroidota bacterium]
MKHFTKTLAFAILTTVSLQASAQTQEEMKKWMDYSTPSDVHKMIAKSDGNWDEEITFWMAPGTPEQTMKSSCTNKMILGGRYQEATHIGDFGGMPFEGRGTLAYDNLTKKLITTWIDNMGTGLMYMEGTWDDATRSVTFKGKMVEPMAGKEINVKEVWKIVDDNTQEVDMYHEKDGQEFKTMHIKLTRKK